MIDTNKIIFHSSLSGFGAYADPVDFATPTIPPINIPAGTYVGPIRAFAVLNNAQSITQIKLQLVGLESFWRIVPGLLTLDFPQHSGVQYQIQCMSYFTGGSIVVDAYIINQTGSSVPIPSITFTYKAQRLNAPFQL